MHSIITDKDWFNERFYDSKGWESCWRSRDDPHRSFLVERISKFSPNSVLEIGCACGPNLYGIAKKFPDAKVRGIDINPVAVQKGNEWFKGEGIFNVKLEVGRAQELEQFGDKSFDVVFTDAVLFYISPDEIKHVVKEMLRIGRVIVLNEWHCFNKWLASLLNKYHYLKLRCILSRRRFRTLNLSFKTKSAALGLFVGHWVRGYRTLFGQFVPREKIYITKLPKELWNDKRWQRWGAIIEVVE